MELTQRDKAILDFERGWWAQPGPKAARILEMFELSSQRYYEILGELVGSDEALEYDPLLVRRLRRQRERRRRERKGPHVRESEGP